MNNLPKRVLHWGGFPYGLGGVSFFLTNLYENINRDILQFDFLTVHNDGFHNDRISKMGGRIYKKIYSKKESILKHHQSLDDFFKKHAHEYCAVHMHMNFMRYYAPLKYAKKYGIPIRIYHSHASADMHNSKSMIGKITEYDARNNVDKYATHLFACSDSAGKYMFDKKSFEIINNAIDSDKYIFNENIRTEKRRELNLGDSFVVGTVGWISEHKNPDITLKIFNEIVNINPNSKLVMVGEGKLKEKIWQMASEYGISEKVLLVGQRNDVPELMQAFDCFLLPSRFEGLGIVYIEAQAAGLPCFASEGVVPMEAKVTELMNYIALDKPAEIWANKVVESHNIERRNMKSEIVKAGYDIKNLASQLQCFYLENGK